MAAKNFGDLLLQSGAITAEQLAIAVAEQKRNHRLLGELVTELGFASPQQVARVVARMADARYLELGPGDVPPELGSVVDETLARRHVLVPVAREGRLLTVAMANPLDIVAVDRLRATTGHDVEIVVASEPEVQESIERLYGGEDGERTLDELVETARKAVSNEQEKETRELTPVIELVERLLAEATRRRATDIHIEPEEHVVRIRYRVDGVLLAGVSLTRDLKSSVTARVKILAGLDISETRLPQDGRIRIRLGHRTLDLRVSTMPTVHGENVVLRVLDKSSLVQGLASIMPPREQEALEGLLATQTGMILVTGPTGSGKTTTLYSAISALDSSRYKIATLEDPVEYELPLIRQSQINEKTGFGFAEGLRALLRQDPDIVFVGEMRDKTTSSIAVRAALTGHLVLSTLHTTSALGTLTRLAQMGIAPDLLITSVRGILAQRLVRVVCSGCAVPDTPAPGLLDRFGSGASAPGAVWKRGAGCARCSDTGFKGRRGLYELVRMTPELADAFVRHAPMSELAVIAAASGTRFLREAGIELARSGVTTLSEVLKATADAPIPTAAAREPVHA